MLTALRGELGNVTKACEMVEVTRDTHYRWLKEDEDYKRQVEAIKDNAIDFVEGQLFKLIKGVTAIVHTAGGEKVAYETLPCKTSIIFYLKTQAKNRGYVERQEITGADSQPVKIEIAGNI